MQSPETGSSIGELEDRLHRLEAREDIFSLCTRMATLADAREWDALVDLLTPTVWSDWSELSGEPASETSARDLVAGWRSGLGRLTATHHIIANHEVHIDGDTAEATAYVHAAHRRDGVPFGEGLWIVAGMYNYTLSRIERQWRITEVTFHPRWGSGDASVLSHDVGPRSR